MKKRSIVLWLAVLLLLLCLPAGAATSVDAVIEQTWASIRGQIQNVVNNVVFPAVDMILAVVFFVKLSSAYFDYRKHGQFDFTAPAILFACLCSPSPLRCISGKCWGYKWRAAMT